ncbi:hypothetical protein FNF27_03292 [Cafeteria roenbergensis]|uniref:Uncharacterized protein n=1 Tax=Cafeteria roenbergensis TaxID=33653 RepID=A0A5A8EDK0_CAFRO|nr:hypothetical protein FNF27_03292 [Cafeteria roenbergensis]
MAAAELPVCPFCGDHVRGDLNRHANACVDRLLGIDRAPDRARPAAAVGRRLGGAPGDDGTRPGGGPAGGGGTMITEVLELPPFAPNHGRSRSSSPSSRTPRGRAQVSVSPGTPTYRRSWPGAVLYLQLAGAYGIPSLDVRPERVSAVLQAEGTRMIMGRAVKAQDPAVDSSGWDTFTFRRTAGPLRRPGGDPDCALLRAAQPVPDLDSDGEEEAPRR